MRTIRPARSTRRRLRWWNSFSSTSSVTSSQRSMVWSPSMRISGVTMAARPSSWLKAAKRARAWTLAVMQPGLGRPSPIRKMLRHWVNRAPSWAYSARRWCTPSSPMVTTSWGCRGRSALPRSTVMPGMMPLRDSRSQKGTPCWLVRRIVSSSRIAPLIACASPGVLAIHSRYWRRASADSGMSRTRNCRSSSSLRSSMTMMPLSWATSSWAVSVMDMLMVVAPCRAGVTVDERRMASIWHARTVPRPPPQAVRW